LQLLVISHYFLLLSVIRYVYISFVPSLLWTAIGLWLGTVICSYLYMRYVKSKRPFSIIRVDGDSFLVKTFLVASSLISIFSIGTGVQFFNPNAGLDQFFVIFVLVVWLKYALSDLKQKLDSFVVPRPLPRFPVNEQPHMQ
jgi:hypothetical protein